MDATAAVGPIGATGQSVLDGVVLAVLALYGLAFLAALVRPASGRWPLAAGVAAHVLATVARGVAIGFFPLTGKMESFSAASLAVAVVAVATWRPIRLYVLPLVAVAAIALGAALTFPTALEYPPPLMRTIWYPIHVPLSFLAYGTWTAAAAAGLAWAAGGDREWLGMVDRLALQGFGLWTGGMICGGVWGVLAWGAYFLWDPKVVWSVVLWFHYATFVHLKHVPAMRDRPWVRPALAWAGFAFVLVAYVGTSFFFGRSSHAF
jgi:ABC-type transport system involved in cytochrome c biogenesis permease subunit